MARAFVGALAVSLFVLAAPATADVDRGYVEVVGAGSTITVQDLTKVGSDNDPITDINGTAEAGERVRFVVKHAAQATGTCRIQDGASTSTQTVVLCDPPTSISVTLDDRRDRFTFKSHRPIDITVDSGTGDDKVNVFVHGHVSEVAVSAGQGKDVVNVEQRQGGNVDGNINGGGHNDRITLKGTGLVNGGGGKDKVNVNNGLANTVDCGGFNEKNVTADAFDTLVNCP